MGRGVRIGTVVAEWFGRPTTETKALSNLMVRSGTGRNATSQLYKNCQNLTCFVASAGGRAALSYSADPHCSSVVHLLPVSCICATIRVYCVNKQLVEPRSHAVRIARRARQYIVSIFMSLTHLAPNKNHDHQENQARLEKVNFKWPPEPLLTPP
jgi:hypothetical protein